MPTSTAGYKTIAVSIAAIVVAIAGRYGIVLSLSDSVVATLVIMGLVMWLMRLATKGPAGKAGDTTQAILQDLLAFLQEQHQYVDPAEGELPDPRGPEGAPVKISGLEGVVTPAPALATPPPDG